MNKVIIEKAFVGNGAIEISGDKANALYLLRKGKLKEIEKQLDYLGEVEFYKDEEIEKAEERAKKEWGKLSEGAKDYWKDLNYPTGVAPAYVKHYYDEFEEYEKCKRELDSLYETFEKEIRESPVMKLASSKVGKEVLFDLYLKIIKGDVDLYEWSIRKLLHL